MNPAPARAQARRWPIAARAGRQPRSISRCSSAPKRCGRLRLDLERRIKVHGARLRCQRNDVSDIGTPKESGHSDPQRNSGRLHRIRRERGPNGPIFRSVLRVTPGLPSCFGRCNPKSGSRKNPFIGSTSGFADRGSLALEGVPPLAQHSRRTTDGLVAARGSFWQVAARAYALPDTRLLFQESATRPEASPYRTPLLECSKLGSDGSLVRGSSAQLPLPKWTGPRQQRGQGPWLVGLA